MTRYQYFNMLYPDKAKEIDQGYEEASRIIWDLFTKYTGIRKLFSFFIIPPKNTPEGSAQGAGYTEEHP